MSGTSAMSGLRHAWGRLRAAGTFGVRYDALTDRYVCRSGRHDAEDERELTCPCGDRPATTAVPYGPVFVPAPRMELAT